MVETFLNTHMTRLSCSYEPAESRTPGSWPCSSDVKVCVCVCRCQRKVLRQHVIQVCTLSVMFQWIFITALNCPSSKTGPGRGTPLLHSLPTLTLNIQPQEEKPRSPGPSERPPTLEESMRQLERGIQTGSLCFHFEVFKMQIGAEYWIIILRCTMFIDVNEWQAGTFVLLFYYFKQDLVCPSRLCEGS